jgi:hypothetical protein
MATKKYKVREGFVLHKKLGNQTQPFPAGSEVDLTDEELHDHILQVEPLTLTPAK